MWENLEDDDDDFDEEDHRGVRLPPIHENASLQSSSSQLLGTNNNKSNPNQDPSSPALSRANSHNTKDSFSADAKGPRVFEIDYVGAGTYRTPQIHLFHSRAIEPMKTEEGALSARGLHHRSKEYFIREVQNATNIIAGLMRGEKVTKEKYKPSAPLYYPHFQRALAYERLNQLDKSIADYTVCVRANPTSAVAFFNRAAIYKAKKQYTLAVDDMNRAVRLDPANIEFRNVRAHLFRECGMYSEAVKDTILSKALENQPTLARALVETSSDDIPIDGDLIYVTKLAEDPVIVACETPGPERKKKELEPIVDFLKGLKFFLSFNNNSNVLRQIASKVELRSYPKGTMIFEEGHPGHHFYIIFDGEVSIVKVKKVFEDVTETTILVKMFRGQTFGETAIESKGGLRTAGALASQDTKLLTLHADEYLTILSKFRSLLKEEVRLVLRTSALFHDWDEQKLDYLASFAIIKNFSANTVVLKANEKVPNLIVIKSGIVQLVKPIPKPGLMTVKRSNDRTNGLVINEEFTEVPGLWILQKTWNTYLDDETKRQFAGNTEYVDFTVGILGSGQIFGELAVLDPDLPSPCSAVTSTAVEFYCFESDVLLSVGARFNSTTLRTLRESMTLNDPPADKIGYYFRQKYNWELRKDKLISRLKTGKL